MSTQWNLHAFVLSTGVIIVPVDLLNLPAIFGRKSLNLNLAAVINIEPCQYNNARWRLWDTQR